MRYLIVTLLLTLLSGCSTLGGLRTNLSAETIPTPSTENALKNALMQAFDNSTNESAIIFKINPPESDVKRYIQSGMTLTDIYCDVFFRQTNLSFRKRKFGRSGTNDVGTAIAAALGLSNVGPKVISGVATGFGLADQSWRNYDESFVVSPDLDVVRSLVLAAQDQFRKETFDNAPKDYMTARSSVIRYAGLCSFLGMQSLMNQSVNQQRKALQDAAKATSPPPAAVTPLVTPEAAAGRIPNL